MRKDSYVSMRQEAIDKAIRSALNEIPIERRQQLLDECINEIFGKEIPGLDDLSFARKK